MLGDALAEQRRLVELLDGLQALARGDAGPLELTEVDLAEVVDAAASAARERHPGLRLHAELPDAPVAMRGWEPGLRLLADNLVENAVRHGRAGGEIRVTLDPARAGEDGGALLTVDDDGPGIPDADRARIFAPSRAWRPPTARARASASRSSSSRCATTARASTSATRRSAGRASACASRRARSKRVHPLARSKREPRLRGAFVTCGCGPVLRPTLDFPVGRRACVE